MRARCRSAIEQPSRAVSVRCSPEYHGTEDKRLHTRAASGRSNRSRRTGTRVAKSEFVRKTGVLFARLHAQDSTEGCQSDLVGGSGSSRTRQTVRHHPAWQAGGGRARLCRLGAVVPRALVRPAPDVGTARARRSAGAQPRTDARLRAVTRYLVDTDVVISAAAPTATVC